jgi:hypothetical protein
VTSTGSGLDRGHDATTCDGVCRCRRRHDDDDVGALLTSLNLDLDRGLGSLSIGFLSARIRRLRRYDRLEMTAVRTETTSRDCLPFRRIAEVVVVVAVAVVGACLTRRSTFPRLLVSCLLVMRLGFCTVRRWRSLTV